MLDVCIGIAVTKIKNDNKNIRMNYIEIIYLFNPISVLNCLSFKLDIFYTFVNIMFVLNGNNFIGCLFFIIGIFSSPGYIFINISLAVYFIAENNFEFFKKFAINSIIATLLIFFGIYVKDFLDLTRAFFNLLTDIKTIYFNYYIINDSLPNIGYLWNTIPEVIIILSYLYLTLITKLDIS